jgi:hypothetical protein
MERRPARVEAIFSVPPIRWHSPYQNGEHRSADSGWLRAELLAAARRINSQLNTTHVIRCGMSVHLMRSERML